MSSRNYQKNGAKCGRSDKNAKARFSTWLREFRTRALSHGIARSTLETVFRNVTLNAEVIDADRHQPEHVLGPDSYLARIASPSRIAKGAARRERLRDDLVRLETAFGVDRDILLGIWGAESDFGSVMGTFPVIEALATLAFDGRRRDFAEGELLQAIRIVESGEFAPESLAGSWAGAIGHVQFMPSSFLDHAVDFDGDGRRNILDPASPLDALASAANYLAEAGWRFGARWGLEVHIPVGFDFTLADPAIRNSGTTWRLAGVTAIDGATLPENDDAAILLPAGAAGPAFAVFRNFDVIRSYNPSNAYALAVGHLGDRIAGGEPIRVAWPDNGPPLTRTEIRQLQSKLNDRGFDTGAADGVMGPNTAAGIKRFQSAIGLPPDGFPTRPLFDWLK